MTDTTRATLFGFMIASICAVFLFAYQHYASHFPYYTAWDMDLTTVIDTLLISSKQLSAHFDHTTFGMLILLHGIKTLAYHTHYVAINNLTDLANSINPLLVIAALTHFLRSVSPLVGILIGFCLWLSVQLSFKPSKAISVINLIALLLCPGILLEITVIRSELYAMLFWALALLATAICVRLSSKAKQAAALFIIGLLLGLCFTTKIQAVYYLLFVPVYLLFINDYQNGTLLANVSKLNRLLLVTLNSASLLLFVQLSVVAKQVPTALINHQVLTSCDSFSLNVRWWLSLTLLVLLFCLSLYTFFRAQSKSVTGLAYLNLSSLLCFGFFMSFLLTPLLYGWHLKLALIHSVYMIKVLFMGHIKPGIVLRLGFQSWQQLQSSLAGFYDVQCILLLFGLNVITLFSLSALKIIELSRRQCGYFTVFIVIFCILLLCGVRHGAEIRREIIWLSILPLFLLIVCFNILQASQRLKAYLIPLVFFVTLILIAISVNQSLHYPAVATFWRHRFLHAPLNGNQVAYSRIMHQSYGNMTRKQRAFALNESNQYANYQHFLQRALIANYVNLSQISLLHRGFRLTNANSHTFITQVSPRLKNSLLVNFKLNLIPSQDLAMTLQTLIWQFDKPAHIAFTVSTKPSWLNFTPKTDGTFSSYNQNTQQSKHYLVYYLNPIRIAKLYAHRNTIMNQPVLFVFAKHGL